VLAGEEGQAWGGSPTHPHLDEQARWVLRSAGRQWTGGGDGGKVLANEGYVPQEPCKYASVVAHRYISQSEERHITSIERVVFVGGESSRM